MENEANDRNFAVQKVRFRILQETGHFGVLGSLRPVAIAVRILVLTEPRKSGQPLFVAEVVASSGIGGQGIGGVAAMRQRPER